MSALYDVADQWVRVLWVLSWQIAVLVGLVWGVSLLCRRASSNFRYWLWCIVLFRLCLPVNVALPFGIGSNVRQAAETCARSVLPQPEAAPPAAFAPAAAPSMDLRLPALQERDPDQVDLAQTRANRPESRPMTLNAKIALGWMLLSVSIAALILIRSLQARRLLTACPRVTRPDLVAFIEQLRIRCSLRHPVRTLCFPASHGSRSPAVIGVVRPTVVLPPQMVEEWSLEDLEPVVLHELAHIKRGDLLVNLVQMAVQAVYFFHPLVWYANARIRRERELVCDDLAVLHSGGQRKRYSQSIVRVLDEIAKEEPLLGAVGLGMTEYRNSLARRIVRMMRQDYRLHKPVGWFSAAALVFLAGLGVALAGERAAAPPPAQTATPESESDKLKLGEEVKKRLSTFTDEQTFTLKDGEAARMDVKENIAAVAAVGLTPHIVEEGTEFDIEFLDRSGNAFADGTMHLPAIHDGKEDGGNFGRSAGNQQVLCKVLIVPERKDGGVAVKVKALFTKLPTQEEIEAVLATKGKTGQVQLDFMKLTRAIMQQQQRQGRYPETLNELDQPPMDACSPDGAAYHYEHERTRFILSSCGEDGVYGNDDDLIRVAGQGTSRSGRRDEIYPLKDEEATVQREYTNPPDRRPQGSASISGKLIDADTGKPVDHGTVFLHYMDTLSAIFIDVPPDGTFKFENIPGGKYALRAIHVAGYMEAKYNPENNDQPFPPFQIKGDEQRTDVILELERARSISGHVSTEDGGALPKDGALQVVAWAEKAAVGPNGDRYEIAVQVPVNPDNGTYLLDGLDGRPVYVMALDFNAQCQDAPYQPTYSPGSFSRDEATPIAFDKDHAVKNIDIRMRKAGGLILEGTVISRTTGKPIPKTLVVVHHKDMLFDRATAYTDEQGRYRFECLGPGDFVAHVDATPWGFVRARKSLTLKASDATTQLDCSLKTGATLAGKFVDEEGKPWRVPLKFGSAWAEGIRHEGGSYSGVSSKYAAGGPEQNVTYFPGEGDDPETTMAFPDESSFVVNGMMPGKAFFTFNPYTEGKQVVRINYDGKDILREGIKVEPQQDVQGVEIVIGASADAGAAKAGSDSTPVEGEGGNLRARCTNNLKQMGIVFKMFINEEKTETYPALSSEPGQLMFSAEEKASGQIGLFPEYLTDASVLVCPASEDASGLNTPEMRANGKRLINDRSYVYLGYAVTNDAEVKTFADAYRAHMAKGSPPLEDLPVAEGMQGSGGGNTLYRLRGGVERRIAKNANDDAEAVKVAGQIPVLIERLGHHETEGGNVLYLDGTVRWVSAGVWPMTKATNDALSELMSLAKK